MNRVILRPATPADVAALLGPLPYRVRAIAGEVDGKVVAIGGLVFRPDGVWAAIVLTEEARRFKLAMHRAARMTLVMAGEMNIPAVYAAAEPGRDGAERWLTRLGFEAAGNGLFVWRPPAACGTTATASPTQR